MTQLSTSAAYLRKEHVADRSAPQGADLRGSVFEEQAWALLATPQTVESLQRVASRSEVGRETQADRGYIERMLQRLLDADLIELSPDS